jgi:hypothetical protein
LFQKFHARFDKYKTIYVVRQYSGHEILHRLGIRPGAPVIVFNEEEVRWEDKHLGKIICEEVARAALEFRASIVDRGVDAGLPGLLNAALRERRHPGLFIGVAPKALTRLPQQPVQDHFAALGDAHTHFVLVEGKQLGVELPTMRALIHALAEKSFYLLVLVQGRKALEDRGEGEDDFWKTPVQEGFSPLATNITLQLRTSGSPERVSREEVYSVNDLYAKPEKLANRIRHFLKVYVARK